MGNVCGGPPKEQGRGKPIDAVGVKKPSNQAQKESDMGNMGSK